MRKITSLLLAISVIIMLSSCSKRDLGISSSSQESSEMESSAEVVAVEEQPPMEETVEDKTLLLAQSYADMLKSKKYYITCTAIIDFQGMELSNEMIIGVEGDNYSIRITSDVTGVPVTIRTLVYEGKYYMINEAQKTYSEVTADQISNSFNPNFNTLDYMGKGEEEFAGNLAIYHEFLEGEDVVKFYFVDDKLVGLTRSLKDQEIETMQLKISGFSANVPDKLIAAPLGYTKQ